ncbi:MAG TPA: hypothetical protein VFU90_08995 [Candidatus Tumulicola sp.]|nr:hypothetical protein [Candidatus Tumulicola sp.]
MAPAPVVPAVVHKTSYRTKPGTRVTVTPVGGNAAPAPNIPIQPKGGAQAAAAASQPASATASPVAPSNATEGTAAAADLGAAAPPSEGTTAASPDLPEPEAFRRIAAVHRAEKRFAEKQRAFAESQRTNAAQLQRVSTLENAAKAAQQNPLAAVQALGLTPQQVLDAILGDAAKTPQQRQEEAMRATAQRQADIEAEIRRDRERYAQEQQTRQVTSHIEANITPIFAPTDAYPHLKHAASITGEDLGQAIYREQVRVWKATGGQNGGRIPTPKEIADKAESLYAQKAALLRGKSTEPTKPATSSGTAPPPANRESAQVTKPSSPYARRDKRAYTAKVVAR